jgi:phospholipid-binding lipoprotein MlaA
MNRRFYTSAMRLDRNYFRPLARLYRALTPGPIGFAIHNMITNLGEPVAIVNDALQFRPRPFARDAFRLAANTTAGLGGMIDVAAMHGLTHHDNDFGITLGVWGVRPGPYLFLPVVGPSTVRDAIGTGVDVLLNPFTYLRFPGRLTMQYTTAIVGAFDRRVATESDLEILTADAADPYATLRSVYLQSREAEIRGGESAAPVLPPLDEPAPAPTASPTAPAPGPSTDAAPVLQPAHQAFSEAAASDPDAPMATAFPGDTDHAAPRYLAAAD